MPEIIKFIKLGTKVYNKYTAQHGYLTHVCVSTDLSIRYIFQPIGAINKKPENSEFTLESAFAKKGLKYISAPFPTEVLDTVVTQKVSGIKGTVMQLQAHVNGCFHVLVQQQGVEGGHVIDFSILELSGSKINTETISCVFPTEKAKHVGSPVSTANVDCMV